MRRTKDGSANHAGCGKELENGTTWVEGVWSGEAPSRFVERGERAVLDTPDLLHELNAVRGCLCFRKGLKGPEASWSLVFVFPRRVHEILLQRSQKTKRDEEEG